MRFFYDRLRTVSECSRARFDSKTAKKKLPSIEADVLGRVQTTVSPCVHAGQRSIVREGAVLLHENLFLCTVCKNGRLKRLNLQIEVELSIQERPRKKRYHTTHTRPRVGSNYHFSPPYGFLEGPFCGSELHCSTRTVSAEILRGAFEAKQHNASGDSDSDYSDGDERKLRWCAFAFAVV
jgi:hypothetical protein